MERGSDKHGPILDDAMAREAEDYTRGAPVSSRTDEARDPESASDEAPEPAWIPGGEHPEGAYPPLTGAAADARSRLGRSIPRAALPADRLGVLRGAEQLHVPPDVRAELERLPTDDRVYHTVYEIWEALGYGNEGDTGRRE